MKRRLPIGIQDFVSIREEGFCYVDKTERIHELISGSGRAFFLSRPRRFGKSLLCSTLGAIFEGRRELFGEIPVFFFKSDTTEEMSFDEFYTDTSLLVFY